jgi:hypothetical protein
MRDCEAPMLGMQVATLVILLGGSLMRTSDCTSTESGSGGATTDTSELKAERDSALEKAEKAVAVSEDLAMQLRDKTRQLNDLRSRAASGDPDGTTYFEPLLAPAPESAE